MMNNTLDINYKPTKLQYRALNTLFDNIHNELLFGGSASVGKTRLLVYFSILYCLKYPGIRGLWGRSKLNSIKMTTLKTFFDISREWNIKSLYEFNQQSNTIKFFNGSEIVLKDLFQYPSDPEYTSLGSVELTFACIDECSEVKEKAYNILKSRLRYKLNEYNLIPKILIVSNPTQGWLYDLFYEPYVKENLDENKSVILGKPEDNPYNNQHYIEMLKNLKGSDYQRLYLGNWDYHTEDNDIFEFSKLNDMFYNTQNFTKDITKYLTVDVAMAGKDKTILCLWYNLTLIRIYKLDKNDTNELVTLIKRIEVEEKIRRSNIIIDATGVGKGVSDTIKGSIQYIASSKPLNSENYNHLKSQLFFKFSEYVNDFKISIIDKTYKDEIIKEFRAYKNEKIDTDSKLQITTKERVKVEIGRSPDFSDSIVLRMYFELIKKPKKIMIEKI